MAADHGDHVTPDQFKGRARRARNSPDVAVRRRHARADRRDPRRRHRRRDRTTTPPHRMGGHGRAHERDDKEPTNETTREEPTNETTREDRAGQRRPKDGRQRSGADAGAQPPRPPAPATPQTPTVDRDATDARQAVHRQGSPRSGPDRHALHPAGRAPAGFFGFVKPAGPAAGGRDVFVLGSAVKHVDGTDVERAEWPRLDGKRIAVDRTARRPAGRPQATAARPAQDLRRARRPAGRPRGTPKGRQRPLQAHRGAVAPLLHEQHSGDRGPNTAPRPQLRPMARACNRVDSPT